MNQTQKILPPAMFVSDLLVVVVALFLATRMRVLLPVGESFSESAAQLPLVLYVLIAGIWTLTYVALGCYRQKHAAQMTVVIPQAAKAWLLAILMIAGALYLSFREISRLQIVYFAVAAPGLLIASRLSLQILLGISRTDLLQSLQDTASRQRPIAAELNVWLLAGGMLAVLTVSETLSHLTPNVAVISELQPSPESNTASDVGQVQSPPTSAEAAPPSSTSTQPTDSNPVIVAPLLDRNAAENTWVQAATMSTPRSEFGSAMLGDLVYTAGGWRGSTIPSQGFRSTDSFEAFNPTTNSWLTLPPLPAKRHHAALAALDQNIYVIGGGIGDEAYSETETLFIYDVQSGEWTRGADIPQARRAAAAVSMNNSVYLIGGAGHVTDEELRQLLRYDPATDTWTALALMNVPREHLAAVVWGGRIYAVAGRRNTFSHSSIEVYDPELDAWSMLPSMHIPRSGPAAAVLNGRIYVFGGEVYANPPISVNRVESFDIDTQTWREETPMPIPLNAASAVAHDNRLWVIGGTERGGDAVNFGRVLVFTP